MRLGKLWKASRFQYEIDATSIFADGFESGDFSRWSSVVGESPSAPYFEDPFIAATASGNLQDVEIQEVCHYAGTAGCVSERDSRPVSGRPEGH